VSARIRLDIAYDGTSFSGWSRQPGLRTVQGEIEAALGLVFRRSGGAPGLVVAGRTDAGVHATGQVAHLDLSAEQLQRLEWHRGEADGGVPALARRINGILGADSDIGISGSSIAPDGFDARFSAVWRRYEYRIADGAVPWNPLERHRTLRHPGTLDPARMNEAARGLLGLHDWAAYCKQREGATTIRTLQEFHWERGADGILVARVRADAFCHSMVRSLVGACIAVGEGRLEPGELAGIRDAMERTAAFAVAAAKGLTLTEVGYPPDAELRARAERTRARREPGESLTAEPRIG